MIAVDLPVLIRLLRTKLSENDSLDIIKALADKEEINRLLNVLQMQEYIAHLDKKWNRSITLLKCFVAGSSLTILYLIATHFPDTHLIHP